MAAIKVYTCDVCGKQRGDTNHWFSAFTYIADGAHTIASAGSGPESYAGTHIVFGVWGEQDRRGALHLCGQGCAIKYLEKFLTCAAEVHE